MNKQEVVFCKTVFEKIKYNFDEQEIWDSDEYYNNLSLTKIKTLNSNKKTIEKCIKESKGFLKIFKQHLFNQNLELVSPEITTSFSPDNNLNSLCNLSACTIDKIIHTENKSFNEELINNEKNKIFEAININNFIKPVNQSRLLSAYRDIELKKGTKFIFIDVLAPYFRGTKKLLVFDRYLRNRKKGYQNLIRFIDLCSNLSTLEIHTFSYKSDEKNKFDIEFGELESELKLRYGNVRVVMASGSSHRRKIITDEFEIKIDPGLDFVNDDFICENNDVDIQIRRIEK